MPIFTSNGWTITKQALLLLSLSVIANSAFANVCKDDINALCEAEKGDRKAVMECLESNKSELSSECSAQVDKMMAQGGKSGGRSNACKDDINSLCEAEKGDQKAVMECLESNKSELSGGCAEQVDKMMAQGGKSGGKGNVCKDAIEEYCSDVRSEGREAVVACLESHKSDLSSECAARVDKMLAQ
jgi:Golgi apparatus protein 1